MQIKKSLKKIKRKEMNEKGRDSNSNLGLYIATLPSQPNRLFPRKRCMWAIFYLKFLRVGDAHVHFEAAGAKQRWGAKTTYCGCLLGSSLLIQERILQELFYVESEWSDSFPPHWNSPGRHSCQQETGEQERSRTHLLKGTFM